LQIYEFFRNPSVRKWKSRPRCFSGLPYGIRITNVTFFYFCILWINGCKMP